MLRETFADKIYVVFKTFFKKKKQQQQQQKTTTSKQVEGRSVHNSCSFKRYLSFRICCRSPVSMFDIHILYFICGNSYTILIIPSYTPFLNNLNERQPYILISSSVHSYCTAVKRITAKCTHNSNVKTFSQL